MGDGHGDLEGRQQGPVALSLVNRRLEEHEDTLPGPVGSAHQVFRCPGVDRAFGERPGAAVPRQSRPGSAAPFLGSRSAKILGGQVVIGSNGGVLAYM